MGMVLLLDDLSNGLGEVLQVWMQMVGCDQVLEMKPEAFNGIEKGAVLGQPDDVQSFLKQRQSGERGPTAVIRGVVQDENHFLLRRHTCHEMFNELDETLTVLAVVGLIQDHASVPVVCAEEMHELR